MEFFTKQAFTPSPVALYIFLRSSKPAYPFIDKHITQAISKQSTTLNVIGTEFILESL